LTRRRVATRRKWPASWTRTGGFAPIDYAPFIHNLCDGSLINICPQRAYFLANSDTGVTPLSAASAGEFP
jgi:hypothetical protein